jgi:hypothetical protein
MIRTHIRVGLLMLFLCLGAVVGFGQDEAQPQSHNTKEYSSFTITTTGNFVKFFDNTGTMSNNFEVKPNNAPATMTVTIFGCMTGGTCSPSALATSSGTGSQVLSVSSGGPWDYYKVTASWTGQSNANGITINRTATVAKSGGVGGGIGVHGTLTTNDCVSVFDSTTIQDAGPCAAGETFQVNGVNTLSQSTLNFINSANITFSNPTAGQVSAAVSFPASTVFNNQANTFGAFLQQFQAGANFRLLDTTDTTKKVGFDLSNISTATTRTVNFPDANSTTVQADTGTLHNFLTAISAQGVISKAQPSFSDISGSLALSGLNTQAADTVVMNATGSSATPTAVSLASLGGTNSCAGATDTLIYNSSTHALGCHQISGSGGSGTVTNFTSGNLSPLFTTSVATSSTTPALTFSLSNAAANTILGNFTGSSAAPSYSTINGGSSCGDATHALSFTNGTGFGCQAISGGGNVSNSGTPTNGQIAQWTSATVIQGVPATLAGSLFANQGTTITVLHGNAAGNPSWSAVSLVNDVTGNLAVSHLNSGTGASSSTFWRGDGTWVTPTDTGFANPMTTLGDLIAGGASGAASRLAGPTTPNGIAQALTSTPSSGAATTPSWSIPGVAIDAQTGTSFTIPVADDVHFVTGNNAAATAWTGFTLANNYAFSFMNLGAGLITYTPASGTVNGSATQIIPQNWFGFHYTDNTNTFMPVLPSIGAFPNCTDTGGNHINFTSATGAFSCGTSNSGGSSGLSGMTAGQVPLAATASTVTSSKALAGAGAGITTGPASAVTSLDVAEFTGTGGQIADSSVAVANLVTQTSNAASGQICTYTGANKVCVPATALPSGVTATTQSAADNSTKVATTAYVDAHHIASGTAAMGTSAIASGACATVVTVAATGVATTDVLTAGFNTDPTAVTGYGASGTGAVVSIYPYPTANNVNFKVCNSTASSITPGALTLNWKVTR